MTSAVFTAVSSHMLKYKGIVMVETLTGIVVKLTIGLALAFVAVVFMSTTVSKPVWEKYSEQEKQNVSKSLTCIAIIAFMIPWTFG